MVKCIYCGTKLKFYPKDKAHPFSCPNCYNEDFFLDEKTGTIKIDYSDNDWKRQTGTWTKTEKKLGNKNNPNRWKNWEGKEERPAIRIFNHKMV